MRKIIFTRPDGGISIVTPVISDVDPESFTEADAEKRAWEKLPADVINPRFEEANEVPTDRTFRNAWKDAGKIEVDMPKAREIHRDNLRRMRAPLLAALDVEYQRADERGDVAKKAEISRTKQALRDVTKFASIMTAKTPDELKQVIPDELK